MLEIRPNGKLFKVNDEQDIDVTDEAPFYMFMPCIVTENVRLIDILLILEKNVDIFDTMLNDCWVKDLVRHGLEKPQRPYTLELEDDLEFLELYYTAEIYDGKVYGNTQLGLHGLSCKMEEDIDHPHYGELKRGDRVEYSISLNPVNDLCLIPLKLNSRLKIYKSDDSSSTRSDIILPEMEVTLGQILHGITYDLSFYGSNEDKLAFNEELNAIVSEFNLDNEKEL